MAPLGDGVPSPQIFVVMLSEISVIYVKNGEKWRFWAKVQAGKVWLKSSSQPGRRTQKKFRVGMLSLWEGGTHPQNFFGLTSLNFGYISKKQWKMTFFYRKMSGEGSPLPLPPLKPYPAISHTHIAYSL